MESRETLKEIIARTEQGKSFKEWFAELPEPYSSQAIENWESDKNQMNKPTANSLGSALILGFAWTNSPQGTKYWVDAHNKYAKK